MVNTPITVALAIALLSVRAPAQTRGLVVPVPSASSIRVQSDSFVGPDGARHRFDVYRSASASGRLPAVVFVNVVGPSMREWKSYVDWAMLVTKRNLTGVLYDGPTYNQTLSASQNQQTAEAFADSLMSALRHRGERYHVDGGNVVLWAGSANTSAGTPLALAGARHGIRGYVLYYGAGVVGSPRLDVPVFIARAGLDAPGLNRELDSLTSRLMSVGVAVTLVNYPGGRHAFDLLDSTAMSARIVEQTLDFAESAVSVGMRSAITADTLEVRAARAFTERRWAEAVQLYHVISTARPKAAGVAWRLGLSELESGEPARALVSFTRARENGQGGARDIGIPAIRSAIRAGNSAAAVEWTLWALRAFPRIRADLASDSELAPMLENPSVKSGSPPGN